MTFATFAALQTAAQTSSGALSEERFFRGSVTSKATGGIWVDMWTSSAGYPTAGVSPGSAAGVACTSSTTGAFPYLRNPSGGGNKRYLLSVGMAPGNGAVMMIIDRLVHTSSLSGTVTTAQTVNSTALTRYTTGDGVMVALVCWTPTGTTASNVTVSYTNQANTSGRTTISQAAWTAGFGQGSALAPVAGQMQILPLAAGDTGVRSVQSVTLSASTLTAGDFGIILFKPLTIINMENANYQEKDFVINTNSLPELQDSACLSMVWIGGGQASTGSMTGNIKTIEG